MKGFKVVFTGTDIFPLHTNHFDNAKRVAMQYNRETGKEAVIYGFVSNGEIRTIETVRKPSRT